MDKRLILAVAGSGKTTHLIEQLDEERRFLLIAYTNNNIKNLKNAIARKFGFLPRNISVMSYFSFAYGFCLKPFLGRKLGLQGIDFVGKAHVKASGVDRFLSKNKYAYSYRLAARISQPDVASYVASR